MKQKLSAFLLTLIMLVYITPVYGEENPLNLQSEAIILMEETTGKVLYEKNANQIMYPASTSKILTALIALENGSPEDMIQVGREVNDVPLDASKAGHVMGDKITLRQLLIALMLPSGNDSAYVIASQVVKKTSGNENIDAISANNQFAVIMNERAKQIGVKNTNFANPSGYHDDKHYTTAYDLALITKEALKNPAFKEIFGTSEFVMNYEGQSERTAQWKNRNLLINQGSNYYYQYATGGKTGNTDEAGECLVATATKDGVSLIAVVLKSPTDARWNETKALFEYGFNKYALNQFVKAGELIEIVPVDKASPKSPSGLEVVAKSDLIDLIEKDKLNQVEKAIVWDQELIEAPVAVGQVVGKVTYSLDGNTIGEVPLIAKVAIEKRTILEAIFSISAIPYWIGIIGGGGLIGLIIYIINKRRNRRGFRIKY